MKAHKCGHSNRFSYIKTVLCVMSSLQRVKQEIRNIIDSICVISATLYAVGGQKSGRQWIDPIHNDDAPAHSVRATFLSHRRNRPSAATYIFSRSRTLQLLLIFLNETRSDREMDDVESIK